MEFAACCVTGALGRGGKSATVRKQDDPTRLETNGAESLRVQSLANSLRENLAHRTDSPSLLCCSGPPRSSSSDLFGMSVSPAPSPSKVARRKRTEPVPDPVGVIACDNFECVVSEGIFDSETWYSARLGSRVFRFCSQECWTSWLGNPGHMGSWSSPLLSYQATPETAMKTSRNEPPPLNLEWNTSPGASPKRDDSRRKNVRSHTGGQYSSSQQYFKSLKQLRVESLSSSGPTSTGFSMLSAGTGAATANDKTCNGSNLPTVMI